MPEQGRLPGFGEPSTVEQLANSTAQAATTIEELRTQVRTDVSAAVRRTFDGEGATGLEYYADQLSEFLIPKGGVGSPARIYHEQIKPAVEAMKKAKELLADAEKYINENGLYIKPDMTVDAMQPDRPEAQALIGVGQGKLDVARKAAEAARQQIRDANKNFAGALDMTRRNLDAWNQVAGGPGKPRITPKAGMAARPRPTPQTSKEEAWKAHEKSEADRDKALDKQYTKKYERGEDYRNELAQTHPMPNDGRNYTAHHNFPVKNHADFERAGIDTTNPVWGSWVESGQHAKFSPQYEKDWDSYFATHQNPSRADVFAEVRRLARKHNYTLPFD
jgi:hypothetical protein